MSDKKTASTQTTPRRRVAKGPRRPQYLDNPELDKFMMMLTAMLAEMSAMRDRMDTYEALAANGAAISKANVEAYKITNEDQTERAVAREAMMKRVFRILLEELEEARLAMSTRDLEKVLEEDNIQLPDDQKSDL